MVGYMVRSVNFMSMGPLTHIIFCEVSSIIRNNAVWNTMTVDKAFCKSTDDSFRRSIVFREGRSISTVNVYFSKDQKLSLPWWKPFSIISLQPGHCLIPLGEWYHTGDSVLVSDVGRLGSQQLFSSARPWWAEVHVVEPMHNFIPATMASFFMILLGNVRSGWRGRLTITHRTSDPIQLTINILLSEVTLWWAFTWHTNIFMHLAHSERSASSLHFLVINFLIMFLPSCWPSAMATTHESIYNHTSGHFFIQTKWTIRCTAQSSVHLEDFPSPLSFSSVLEKGCSAVAVQSWVVPEHYIDLFVNQGWVFFSSVKWSLRTPSEAIGAD